MKNLLIALLALTSSVAMAAKDPFKGRAMNGGYGMAGCGLGSLAFKENDKTQILAATTNGTFGTQTFGITFGTSNCDHGGLSSRDQVQSFIAANTHALQKDISRGNGETLNGLADMMGAQDKMTFKTQLKNNYGKIFAKSNLSAEQITQNIYTVLN